MSEVPEPYAVRGGPFDLKLSRKQDTVTLTVVGDKGDLVASINFSVSSVPRLIAALEMISK